jgi:hypothetical protein
MRSTMLLVALLVGCGGSAAPAPADSGPENVDGCWNYVAGGASGKLELSGRTGTFTMTNGVVDHGGLLHSDEPDGSFVLMFYCAQAECGSVALDGGIVPSDAGGTRFLFQAQGRAMDAATTSTGQEFSATRCP